MENFGIDDFLEMMAAEKGAAQNTLAAYRRDVEQFAAFARVSGVSAFRQSHVSAFVQKLSEDKLAPKTIARKISALREYFKFLYSEREIKDNPAANVLSPKQKKPLPKFLTEEEIRRLIAAAKAHDDCRHRRTAVMMELMYACGLRVSELVSLPENCLNYDKRQIMVKGKGITVNGAGCAGGSECRFRIYGVSGFLFESRAEIRLAFPVKSFFLRTCYP